MTREEKLQLQAAKRLYETSNADQRYVLESLFPELAESKEERIRNEIISALKWANHRGIYDKHIAWLEKQGGQKPADNDMIEALRTEYEKGRADAIAEMQVAWREEDERMLVDCFNILHRSDYPTHKVTKTIDWLKSLKNKHIWKPSNEQIVALRWVLNHIPYDSHKEEISGLLEQLKKLKE